MRVLSEFVASGLNWKHVWKIEFMIEPPKDRVLIISLPILK